MSNRIDLTFSLLKKKKQKALIGYLTAGYPTPRLFAKIVPSLAEAGLDVLEIGVPFSDPIADGPTIQEASQAALKYHVTAKSIFRTVRSLRQAGFELPVVLMTYSNPVYAMGLPAFFSHCQSAGVDGVILPDIIPEEGLEYERAARARGVHVIYLVAPTTPVHRLRFVARKSRGFLYAVSLTGVTGARQQLPPDLGKFVKSVKSVSKIPVAVGFGISTPAQARAVSRMCDGVIVGSAIIKAARQSPEAAARLVRSLKGAIHAS